MKITFIDRMPYREHAMGWYMWTYPEKPHDYIAWIKANMNDPYEVQLRYSSGAGMVETYITSEADYVKFKLTWSGE